MRLNIQQTAALLGEKDNILILTHERPDGDTLGSAFALCRALQLSGKKARVMCQDKIPPSYSFLYSEIEMQDFEPEYIVAVDVADLKLLGSEFKEKYEGKINLCIDHHASNTDYAENLMLEDAAAAAEVVLQLVIAMGITPDRVIAEGVYTGLSTDTGCFRYSNTTSRTLRMAADMIDVGISVNKINQRMFETKTKSYAALERMALKTIKLYCDDRCAVMEISRKMYAKSGADESECHTLSSIPRQIEGVLVGVTIKETKSGTYSISVRTHEPIDASAICMKMGGGGHKRAAGCSLQGSLLSVRNTILEHVKQALDEVVNTLVEEPDYLS
ncbi:MAG: bifunctional oligoribonuclease/PAP phosphatase NrnA [Clostridiales bacterium]|nr:bifunctional oligoribonuclease/PAP phosphatase NrnA [Clostridiales bacterium]